MRETADTLVSIMKKKQKDKFLSPVLKRIFLESKQRKARETSFH